MANKKTYSTMQRISKLYEAKPEELQNHGFSDLDNENCTLYHDSGSAVRVHGRFGNQQDNRFVVTSSIPNGIETAYRALEGFLGITLIEVGN